MWNGEQRRELRVCRELRMSSKNLISVPFLFCFYKKSIFRLSKNKQKIEDQVIICGFLSKGRRN
jgi:hypothetical protein